MYGHQVIEGMQKEIKFIKNGRKPDGGALRVAKESAEAIKNSIHFCFDAVLDGHESLAEVRKGAPQDLFDLCGEHLPYENCFIEYRAIGAESIDGTVDNISEEKIMKRAALVQYNGFKTRFRFFSHIDSRKTWVSSGIDIVVTGNESLLVPAWDLSKTMDDYLTKEIQAVLQWGSLSSFLHILKMLRFLGCKNIESIETHPPEKLQKKRRKNGKLPMFSYKILKIRATGKRKTAEANHNKDLYYNRIHLCRGHFKEYTEERPLFGHLTGRYWWQPSVRGNKSQGVIHKDYAVSMA